nr:LEAF RUST 10 DISEASE-RESISTANCE LOCUS RECEPTOR-LIKE PROTEIN KINASE-like 2.1 [Ipomoea batatas]GMD53698.1 LEAF RUST 10 DISEASE-RESISTANCE LOCUS RECEPTOR-LIKE PROTEIN KINASE-like 2.1 [Ipomoea batatas]
MLAIIMRPKYLVIAFLICVLVIQFPCHSNSRQYCNPSSCGTIHNISFPFRLNTDPENCGKPNYQLTCEQNRTVLTLKSQKYYVQSINYNNFTIRLVDPGVQDNNLCSFPRYALARYRFSRYDVQDNKMYSILSEYNLTAYLNPYAISRAMYEWEGVPLITVPIIFFSCPFPVKSSTSSAFVETTKDCSNKTSGGYAYAKLGPLNASDLRISCQVERITMSSWRIQENVSEINVTSLVEIHDALMYGFELYWFRALCDHCRWGLPLCGLDETNEIRCWNKYIFYEPIMEVDQEQSSMPESSESIALLPNSANSNSIGYFDASSEQLNREYSSKIGAGLEYWNGVSDKLRITRIPDTHSAALARV